MITKIHAATLYSYGYSLVDNEGDVYRIEGVYDNFICIMGVVNDLPHADISYSEIGSTYKILCRPASQLTKEIEHDGKNFIPVDYFEIGDDDSYFFEFDHGNIKLIKTLRKIAEYNVEFDFQFLPSVVVDKLKELYFNLDFPSGTTQNLI